MASRRVLAGTAVALLMLTHAWSAAAQTSDDLFNDQALQRIDLFVSTRDWYWLRVNYMANDYYPANMKWNGTTVTNVAIRSRGTGSRSGTKPALRVDFNRYVTGRTFLGLTAIDLNNSVQDRVLPARDADDEVLPGDGDPGAADGPGGAVSEQRVFRTVRGRRGD